MDKLRTTNNYKRKASIYTQKLLNYFEGREDIKTQSLGGLLRKFQKEKNLIVDGILGPMTAYYLDNPGKKNVGIPVTDPNSKEFRDFKFKSIDTSREELLRGNCPHCAAPITNQICNYCGCLLW